MISKGSTGIHLDPHLITMIHCVECTQNASQVYSQGNKRGQRLGPVQTGPDQHPAFPGGRPPAWCWEAEVTPENPHHPKGELGAAVRSSRVSETLTAVARTSKSRPGPAQLQLQSPPGKRITKETGRARQLYQRPRPGPVRGGAQNSPHSKASKPASHATPSPSPRFRGSRRQKHSGGWGLQGGRTTFPRRLGAHSASGRAAPKRSRLVVQGDKSPGIWASEAGEQRSRDREEG